MNWDHVTTLADQAARKVAQGYPGIDHEDIRQEILTAAWSNPNSLEGLTDAQLVKTFKSTGNRYAATERYDFMHHSAQYVYTPAEVRVLFGAFFNRGLWEKAPLKDDSTRVSAGGVVVALWDLDKAYDLLTSDERVVIAKKHDEFPDDALSPADQKRYERAIDKVVRSLNRRVVMTDVERDDHEGPGSRRAISNASARYATSEV
jgi:hypothetical protein